LNRSGENKGKGGTRITSHVHDGSQLFGKGVDEIETERRRFTWVQAGRKTNTVVPHHELQPVRAVTPQNDLNASATLVGKSMLERVCHQLVDDQAAGNRQIDRQPDPTNLD